MDDELHRLIADTQAPPDVVPLKPLTREALLTLDRLAAEDRIVTTIHGRMLTDVDGLPMAMSAPHTTVAVPASVMVAHAEVVAAGLSAADVPHLRVMPC